MHRRTAHGGNKGGSEPSNLAILASKCGEHPPLIDSQSNAEQSWRKQMAAHAEQMPVFP